MSLALVYSRANVGIRAQIVEVEVHLARGYPSFSIVGLADTEVKESKERVRSAITNSQFEFPIDRRITVNLAPADLPKESGRYDLAIALGILAASNQIPKTILSVYEFAGELALSGELRAVQGALPMVMATKAAGRSIILPAVNANECARINGAEIYTAKTLLEVCHHLKGNARLNCVAYSNASSEIHYADLTEVRGQPLAKRALEIAAAGGHSLLMLGAPGTGKTMLANRLPGILPDLNDEESLEVAAIYSLRFPASNLAWNSRPFRAPHHSASSVALVGGGRQPKPGEVSLAHHGVLFLDELPEFNRMGLEALREPLEAGCVTISRAAYNLEYPAKFQLIAAMNPCPCGYFGDDNSRCRCSLEHIARYQNRISGPLLDRIDLQVQMSPQNNKELFNKKDQFEETSVNVKQRVIIARQRQRERCGRLNADLSPTLLEKDCALVKTDEDFMYDALNKFGFSARAYHRILKIARTIADLEGAKIIERKHLQEALLYKKIKLS